MRPNPGAATVEALVAAGGRLAYFRDLPAPAQMAAAQYMAFDGEAWSPPDYSRARSMKAALIPAFVSEYGEAVYGAVDVPLAQIPKIMENADGPGPVADLGAWIRSYESYPAHGANRPGSDAWPIILDRERDHDCAMQDGWHRLHAYLRRGLDPIPALYYPTVREAAAFVRENSYEVAPDPALAATLKDVAGPLAKPDVREALGQCVRVSERIVRALHRAGIPAFQVVGGWYWADPAKLAVGVLAEVGHTPRTRNAYMRSDGMVRIGHDWVRAGGYIIDGTSAQFGAEPLAIVPFGDPRYDERHERHA